MLIGENIEKRLTDGIQRRGALTQPPSGIKESRNK